MADHLRWGILATGSIARQFAKGLKVCKTGELVATASRSQDKADAFAAEHGGKGYDSVEALLADPGIDAVYIASPHHVHKEHTILAARAGKAILCEKPFTLNAAEATEALAAVEAAGVFFMEAFMYRCSPQMRKVRELLESGAIGAPRMVNAEFAFQAGREWDNFRTDAAVGGGGLMDVGGYCVSLALLVFGSEPSDTMYAKGLDEAGYDGMGAGLLKWPGGEAAHFGTGIHLNMVNDARIYGDAGHLRISSPWKSDPDGTLALHRNGQEPEIFSLGVTNDALYAHEADAVAEHLAAGECPWFTKAESLAMARTLDRLRASAGLRFGTDSE